MGYSLGSFIAQQFAISYPDKVSSIILVASTCGGKDDIPKPTEFIKLKSDIVNKSQNNIPISQQEMKSLITASLGSGWIKLHPESVNIPANICTFQQMKPSLSPRNIEQSEERWMLLGTATKLEWCL